MPQEEAKQEVRLDDVRSQAIIKDLETQRNILGARAAELAGELEVLRMINLSITQSLTKAKGDEVKYRKLAGKLEEELRRHIGKPFLITEDELQKILDTINDIEIVL